MLIPFSPLPGINSDDTTFAAGGRWADGNNVRFRDGVARTIGGWLEFADFNTTTQGRVRNMFAFRRSGATAIAYGASVGNFGGSSSGLFISNGIGGANNRSAAGFPVSISHWSFGTWGEDLIACPKEGTVHVQSGVANATAIENAPDQVTGILVTPERQVLAFGCNEEVSGTFNGLCIRGSDIEDYDDWTTSSSNNGFEHILDGSAGQIVKALQVGAYIAVWTQNGLHVGQFIGDPGQTYRFDLVATNCGLIGPSAVTIADGVAYWVANDKRLFRWVPGSMPAPVPCPVFKDYRDNLARDHRDKIVVSTVSQFGEVWIFYPDNRDVATENSRYIAYCIAESAAFQRPVWFRGTMARTAQLDSGMLSDAIASASYSGQTIAADTDGNVMVQEYGYRASMGSGDLARDWFIQSADFYLNESSKRMMIRGIIPDFEDQVGEVTLTLYMRDRPQSSAVAKGPYALETGTTKKDFRASGKIAAVKFSGGEASGSFARFGKQLFDAVPMGER